MVFAPYAKKIPQVGSLGEEAAQKSARLVVSEKFSCALEIITPQKLVAERNAEEKCFGYSIAVPPRAPQLLRAFCVLIAVVFAVKLLHKFLLIVLLLQTVR